MHMMRMLNTSAKPGHDTIKILHPRKNLSYIPIPTKDDSLFQLTPISHSNNVPTDIRDEARKVRKLTSKEWVLHRVEPEGVLENGKIHSNELQKL